jgi:hypothetical protein
MELGKESDAYCRRQELLNMSVARHGRIWILLHRDIAMDTDNKQYIDVWIGVYDLVYGYFSSQSSSCHIGSK